MVKEMVKNVMHLLKLDLGFKVMLREIIKSITYILLTNNNYVPVANNK